MWPSKISALALSIGFSLVNAQSLKTIAYGPDGLLCPQQPGATVDVEKGLFSTYIAQNTVINFFGNGNTLVINNAPTLVSTVITVTRTRTQGPAPTGFVDEHGRSDE